MLGIDRTNTASGSAIHRSFLLLLLLLVCVMKGAAARIAVK